MQRNLTIFLNIIFSLSWVFFASRISDAQYFSDYLKLASLAIVGVFMLTLLAAMLQKPTLLKTLLFANRLFAIFLGIKLGLNVISKPTAIGILFIFFAVIPFIINSILLGNLRRPASGE